MEVKNILIMDPPAGHFTVTVCININNEVTYAVGSASQFGSLDVCSWLYDK
jgi:hypothetical protein